jgi:hypothetical protein
MAGAEGSCLSCRGRRWKFVTLRRLAANGGDVAETGMLQRARVECLACGGTGREAGGS